MKPGAPLQMQGPYRSPRRIAANMLAMGLVAVLLLARFGCYYLRNWWQFGGSHRFAMAAAHADLAAHQRKGRTP